MPIRFRCESCSQKLSISRRKIGTEVTCPRCSRTMLVPAEGLPPRDETAKQPEQSSPPPHGGGVATHGGAAVATLSGSFGADVPDEEFLLRKAETEFEEMDLTPMVDVTFLLLIFFMITASFSIQKTIETPDPNPDQKGAQAQPIYEDLELSSLKISIDAENRIAVEGEVVPDSAYLADVIRDKSVALQSSEVLLTVAGDALHETVIRVIDACNEAKIEKVRLATSTDASD